jgi:hypothetical protein
LFCNFIVTHKPFSAVELQIICASTGTRNT